MSVAALRKAEKERDEALAQLAMAITTADLLHKMAERVAATLGATGYVEAAGYIHSELVELGLRVKS